MLRSKRRSAPEYKIWSEIIQRCTNRNCKGFVNYGGRGITVCDRWRSYDLFLIDMGRRPSKQLQIDRLDNDLGYSPDNCRWATRKDQANNNRRNHIIEYKGKSMTLQRWGEHLNIKPNTILTRLRRGWAIGRAFEFEGRR